MTQIKINGDYISKSEEDFNAQGENIIAKLPVYKDVLALSDEKVAKIVKSIQDDKALSEKKNIIKAQSRSTTKEYEIIHNECIKVVRGLRKELVNNPNCTPAVLEDFGLNPAQRIIDTDIQRPILDVDLVSGVPQIKYKKSVFDGIRLFCKISYGSEEKEYEETIIRHIWKDSKARMDPSKPETRYYYAYFVYKGQIVGQKSNVASITLEAIK
ncbi:hypothetical protein [Marinifilum sp. D737]|uniref:hypothetical protein n=1 Tax=Marinifilum sp. D737 TaxID=2969628 RepID=UPI0022745960|nr:hypothetical protein [Marinifilum sp. D737]MCY1633472.1 hypothetical protein [Marinifilum sp. D737]